MSITTEIQRLRTNVNNIRQNTSDILDAIENKGVEIPTGSNLDDCAGLISQIETGGGGGNADILCFPFVKKYLQTDGNLDFVIDDDFGYRDKIVCIFKVVSNGSYGDTFNLYRMERENYIRTSRFTFTYTSTTDCINFSTEYGATVGSNSDFVYAFNVKCLLLARNNRYGLMSDWLLPNGYSNDSFTVRCPGASRPNDTEVYFSKIHLLEKSGGTLKVNLYGVVVGSENGTPRKILLPDESGLRDILSDTVYTPTGTGVFTIGED